MADMLREEGRKEAFKEAYIEAQNAEAVRSRQKILLMLLKQINEQQLAELRAVVKRCKSIEQLNRWLVRVVKAKSIQDVGISDTTQDEGA